MTTCGVTDIDDIEDITNLHDFEGLNRDGRGTKELPPKAKKLVKLKTKNGFKVKYLDQSEPVADSIIPGTQKIFVKTWGCSHNNSDSEYMAGQLGSYGYQITGKD